MSKTLFYVFFLLLFIGGCDLDCGKGPTTRWEINEITIINEIFDGENRAIDVEEASYDDLQIFLNFELKQMASLSFRKNRLYALDCSDPKIMLNSISSVKLITVFDINDNYLAGANINEIVTLDGYDLNTISQTESNTDYYFYHNDRTELKLKERIQAGNKFSLDMTIVLSDGKVLKNYFQTCVNKVSFALAKSLDLTNKF